jgi:hypothetical protein
MKYALIIDNTVDTISEVPVEGWEQVDDNVYGGMVKKSDGTFDLSDEAKQKNQQAELDAQTYATNKASGNQKLLDLGLTQAEATALTGYTPPVEE